MAPPNETLLTSTHRACPAEWARTLASGVVPATVHLAMTPTQSFGVQHFAAANHQLILLVDNGSDLQSTIEDGLDLPSVLNVLDVPPGQLSLPRARLCVSGWIESIPLDEQRRLADSAARNRPTGKLLDVGSASTVYRFDMADLRLATAAGTYAIEPSSFWAAEADPLYEVEDTVVGHLDHHHRDQVVAYALRTLSPEDAGRLRDVSVTGMDRYGFDMLCAVGHSYLSLRASFGWPVSGEDALGEALCRVLHCGCGRPQRT